jgi:ABC-type branched-subunit amino acid transport system ATPase component
MIKTISMRFGSNGAQDPVSFSPSAVTVFIGPNGGGKSQALRELFNAFTSDSTTAQQGVQLGVTS